MDCGFPLISEGERNQTIFQQEKKQHHERHTMENISHCFFFGESLFSSNVALLLSLASFVVRLEFSFLLLLFSSFSPSSSRIFYSNPLAPSCNRVDRHYTSYKRVIPSLWEVCQCVMSVILKHGSFQFVFFSGWCSWTILERICSHSMRSFHMPMGSLSSNKGFNFIEPIGLRCLLPLAR